MVVINRSILSKNIHRSNHALRRSSLIIASLIAWVATDAIVSDAKASRSAPKLISGSVSSSTTASASAEYDSHTIINQTTDKAIIEWDNFSVSANEHLEYKVPSASSVTLNRVVGQDLSIIAGKLSSNGQLIITNPNGVVFSEGAQVDSAGLIATTHQISDVDFLNENYNFIHHEDAEGMIINEGTIKVADTGAVALVAPGVENRGVIIANHGTVALSTGHSLTLDFYGDNLINFTVNGQMALPQNENGETIQSRITQTESGQIIADAGKIIVSATVASNVINNTINLDGVVQANSIADKNGEIILYADYGNVTVSGNVLAQGDDIGEVGGSTSITGDMVHITGDALIDASGMNGGGTILIGGDYQGQGALKTATTTTIDTGAQINADALNDGDGGTIITWSDDHTEVHGALSVRGAGDEGAAGFIETSGKNSLDVSGISTDLSAENGQGGGHWLLDPATITVDSSLASAIVSTLNSNSDYTLMTDTGEGTITIASSISWSGTGNLIIQAFGDVNINADITGTNGGLSIDANNGSGNNTIIATSNIDVNDFTLVDGQWKQIGGTTAGITAGALPTLTVRNDFQISGGTFERFADGSGASGDPYQITDAFGLQGLDTIAALSNTDSYILNNDIDLQVDGVIDVRQWNGGEGWEPISGDLSAERFNGTLDGNNYTIHDLFISRTANDQGLFNEAEALAVFKNITISNANVTGGVSVAAFVSEAHEALFDNVHIVDSTVTGVDVSQPRSYVGALVGWGGGGPTIRNSSAVNTTINSAEDRSGGLVAYMVGGSIDNSFTDNIVINGDIDEAASLGGLVGYVHNNVTITNSYATNVSITGYLYIGGLLGVIRSDGVVDNVFATGNIHSGAVTVGGLIGQAGTVLEETQTTISNAFSTVNVTARDDDRDDYVGGLIGELRFASLSNAYSSGTVEFDGGITGGVNRMGALIGYMSEASSSVDNVHWNADTVSGTAIGDHEAGTVGSNMSGIAAADFVNESSYTHLDFTDKWDIIEGQSMAYLKPLLTGVTGSRADGDTAAFVINGEIQNVSSTLQSDSTGTTYWALISKVSDNDVLTVYLDNETNNAQAIYVADGTESLIDSNLNLTANTVTLSGASGKTLNNTSLSSAIASADTSDMLFTATGDNITFTSGSNFITSNAYTISGDLNTGSGSQTFNNTVTLTDDATLTASTVNFASTLNGAQALTITGNANFDAAVGGITSLSSLSVSGTSDIGANISTTGNQTYTGAVSIDDGVTSTFSTTDSNINFVSTLNGNAGGGNENVVFDTGSGILNILGSVGDSNAFNQITLTQTGGATFSDSLDAATVTLTDTNGTITFSGDTTISSALVTTNQTYSLSLTGSNNTIAGDTNFLNTGSVTIGNGAADTTTFTGGLGLTGNASNPTLVNLAGTINTNDSQINIGNASLNANTSIDAGTSSVSISTVNGDSNSLSLSADAGITQNGNFSGLTTFTANDAIALNSITTSGTQTYNAAVTLSADSTLAASTVNFASTLDGAQALTITGNANFDAAVGGITSLSSLSVSGTSDIGANISTTGNQTYTGAVSIDDGVTSTFSTTDSNINFVSTLNGNAGGGNENVVFDTGSGILNILGSVGDSNAFNQITLTQTGGATFSDSLDAATVTLTDTNGTITFSGDTTISSALVTTNQTYSLSLTGSNNTIAGDTNFLNTGSVTIGNGAADTTTFTGGLGLTGNASNPTLVNLAGTINTNDSQINIGNASLNANTSIDAGTSSVSISTVNGDSNSLSLSADAGITQNGNFSGLTTFTANDAIALNSITTSGTQTYNAAVTLSADSTLAASTVNFASTLDGAQALTITGNANFDAAVGGITSLSSLSVSGTSDIGADVSTTGTQTYNGASTLSVDSDLTASTVNFGSTLDGVQNLTITGNADFDGAVGGSTQLTSLNISGSANIGADISTTGIQTYSGLATIEGDNTLSANDINLGSSIQGVDGNDNLTLNVTETYNLDASKFNGLQNLTLSGAGGTNINGDLSLTGTLTANSTLGFDSDSTLTLAAVNFNDTVTTNKNIDINLSDTGKATFASASADNTFGSLTINKNQFTVNSDATITTQQTNAATDQIFFTAGNAKFDINGLAIIDPQIIPDVTDVPEQVIRENVDVITHTVKQNTLITPEIINFDTADNTVPNIFTPVPQTPVVDNNTQVQNTAPVPNNLAPNTPELKPVLDAQAPINNENQIVDNAPIQKVESQNNRPSMFITDNKNDTDDNSINYNQTYNNSNGDSYDDSYGNSYDGSYDGSNDDSNDGE